MSRTRTGRWRATAWLTLLALVVSALAPTAAGAADPPFLTAKAPYITLTVPGDVKAIISVGETVDGVLFEGIPDGIGIVPPDDDDDDDDRRGRDDDDGDDAAAATVDVYVNHEQSTVPFQGERDFVDSSVTKWTLDTTTGEILAADVAIPSSDGFLRFCSSAVVGPAEGFDDYVYFTGEETNDVVDVPAGAPYGSDPAVDPQRQGGLAVALNAETGEYAPIAGMGRHNHENTIALPGYSRIVTLSTDDTFTATTSQLYMYLASSQKTLFADKGSLWAFQVTHKNGEKVKAGDPFNNANDYLDLGVDDEMRGRFIRVPKDVARGTTGEAPQDALENWSNANNVFQFVRLEDLAYDRNDPSVVYVADTGATRVVPNPDTGRMHRPPGTGLADNGRIFRFVFDDDNPRKVDSFTVFADGDAPPTHPKFVDFTSPDNLDTSEHSLMVQEDASSAEIWQYEFGSAAWRSIATVNDTGGESSGIVDASAFFGPGTWLLDVQAHSTDVDSDAQSEPGTLIKREDGQLMLMTIPGS